MRECSAAERVVIRVEKGRLAVYDRARMDSERDAYQKRLDVQAEEVYQLAGQARSQGLDFSDDVEIPRAADLASRTQKLLEDPYLKPNRENPDVDPIEIESELRVLLKSSDRETAAIEIALKVAKRMHDLTSDIAQAIDSGLRVGLAVLTEAVLVAPLEGIGEVRIMNNADGSEFLSIDYAGPIRAAGGTAQALGVLIGDMIRRELGVGRYVPTTPEVERVKEEFGLYRVGLQYKPPPEEIEVIVRACPVMVNGEETESQECAGYKEVRNIVNKNNTPRTRIRGGVMLVIGEGLCLKAPKILKHTERLKIPGWEFIAQFAGKSKTDSDESEEIKRRVISKVDRYMDDVIAGRPVFGEPGEPGGFRLRYGRSRATGLAAAGFNPVSMEAHGGFISVGTQLKTERPGKACAATPCIDLDGPTVLLRDGSYLRISTIEQWRTSSTEVISIWDSGEVLSGFGEFLENNKDLVPSGYNRDWWAADLADALDHPDKIESFAAMLGVNRSSLPPGIPFNGAIQRGGENDLERSLRKRDWQLYLRDMELNWEQACQAVKEYGAAVPPPWNFWWSDMPLSFAPQLIDALCQSEINGGRLRMIGAASGWSHDSQFEKIDLPAPSTGEWPRWTMVHDHGVVKSALMTLGVEHHHDDGDIVIPAAWEGLLDGLGLEFATGTIRVAVDASPHISDRLSRIGEATDTIAKENKRMEEIESVRSVERMRAETAARQRGLGISETDTEGRAAAEAIEDPGPDDPSLLKAAYTILDDHEVERALWLVRRLSNLRWEDSVPCRVGSRMGRPEKAGVREMKPMVHALYPIGESGGPQRLLGQAAGKGSIRVEMGPRICDKCGKDTPHLRCHHRLSESVEECGGRTSVRKRRGDHNRRRMGQRTSVPLSKIVETKRRALGLNRVPDRIKAVKGLISIAQTPEPIEKGILRARHGVSVFRDGTSRYDMSDVPLTHFKPSEIGTPWRRLSELGYSHDVFGEALTSDEQMLELLPQDFVASRSARQHLLSTCQFVDDLLIRFYKMKPFYEATEELDLVGHLGIGLAPHTSGGVLCRIIGWTDASAGYAHPLFHAAKRRNCDGDEDSLMMLLDGLLNFSKTILPSGRGGRMDAPLVLSTRIDASEIDKEALNVDCGWSYNKAFYEGTKSQPHPSELENIVDLVEGRLGTVGEVRGYGWTHDSGELDAGPANSSYKTLETMEDKMLAQLAIGRRLRSVSAARVASQVIESHFLPDLRGNLMAFTRQKVRCVKCGHSYRRMPLAGKCIQTTSSSGIGLGSSHDGGTLCGGNVVLTVSEGAVRKYIKITSEVMETYGVDDYTKQRVGWMTDSVDSLFNDDKVTVMTLEDFI
ncbi:MAG: hypothetical protein CMB68_01545 [Euryarchaeota archaeon]|nr:hypothetical protein [Euryarchaeota archaeon]